MKIVNKTKSLLLVLASSLCVFNLVSIKNAHADADVLDAGAKFGITGVSGNLSNINVKIEFTTNVNLDGTNNALLVGLASADDTVLTDARFVTTATSVGVYDEDGVAVNYDVTPSTIGTKTTVESNYTYTIESKDFDVVDDTKDIARLVIIGQKGSEVSTALSFSEVKYSVKFLDAAPTSYSYNALINAPAIDVDYVFDIDGHQEVTGWVGNDSSSFVSGTTRATKDITYSYALNTKTNHNWQDVSEVAATEFASGTHAHQTCTCGAKRLSATSSTLATNEDLVIPKLNHTCVFVPTFDWTSATNPGDKPSVKYACECSIEHVMDADDITISEKQGSRQNPSCLAAGKVTYVASCTYASVPASDEKEYVLAKLDHTLVHHDAVANSLENAGNIEYWTCSECNNYFLDADGTQPTTAEGVVLPKFTLEEPQVVTTYDLYRDGVKQGSSIVLANYDYTYTLTQPFKSTSLKFKWDLQGINSDAYRMRLHNYHGSDKWDMSHSVWFVANGSSLFLMDTTIGDFKKIGGINYTVGIHDIEYTYQAIVNGDTFTGKYYVTVLLDGNVIGSTINEFPLESQTGKLFINGSKTFGKLYAYDYVEDTLEEATVVNVYDINTTGKITSVDSATKFKYTTTSTNYSRIFKFNLCETVANSTSEVIVSLGGDSCCRLWLQKGNNKKFYFAWEVDGHWVDGYYLDGSGSVGLDTEINYEVELGRIRVTAGSNAGKDLVYVKVDGEYLTYTKYADTPYYQSFFYANPSADKGFPITSNVVEIKAVNYEIYDVNYVEPVFETADIISVNDLSYAGTYQEDAIDLLEQRVYSYISTSTYGSVIFKGTFNFVAENFNNGDLNGSQIRFTTGWNNEGMIWLNGGSGTLIPYVNAQYGYLVGTKLPTGKDVSVELGRLAIMDGETFTGKHYFFVKFDGVLVVEYISSSIPEAEYTSSCMFITGKEGNGANTIKNVELTRTVTVKVGTHQEDVEVLRSGLVTIPSFDSSVLPANKRITGWTIEGTETAFNVNSDRVVNDLTIVATIDDFKWKVTFDDEDYYFGNGDEITIPTTTPTKDYDDTYHYVFDCWVDASSASFVEGTIASADATYTSKFTPVAHEYGNYSTVTEPTCTTEGQKKRVCSCGHEDFDSIPIKHTLESVAKVDSTCYEVGHEAHYECSSCHKLFSDAEGTTEVTLASLEIAIQHTLAKVDALAPTCDADGHIEHYECSICHKLFADANYQTEITKASTVVAARHTIVSVAKVDSTCYEVGHEAHYECSVCHKLFSDAEGTTEVTLASLEIAIHHTIVKVSASKATCTKDGNIAHYECSICHKLFEDAAGAKELTLADITIPKAHNTVLIAAKAATCDTDGNVAYYHCKVCGKNFTDEACTQEIALADTVIKATGHKYENGKCLVCDAEDPNYVPTQYIDFGCKSSVSTSMFACLTLLVGLLYIKRRNLNKN